MMSSNRPHPAPSIGSQSKPGQTSLARRLLLNPNTADDLPPLLAAQDAHPELAAELYDFIALALRAFINPWWNRITRYDKDLLPQISRVLAAIIQSLEVRLQAIDFAPLVFHDVPTIITQHFRDYKSAASKATTAYASGGDMTVPQLFHHYQPHIAASAEGKLDDEYYRQVLDQVLKTCLPPEDYEPEVERIVIREVFLKILVYDVIPKVTQPWFIHQTILNIINSRSQAALVYTSPVKSSHVAGLSFHNLLVLVLSALQSFSTTCLALILMYKQTLNTIKLVNASPPRSPTVSTFNPPSSRCPLLGELTVQPDANPHMPISLQVTSATSSPSTPIFPAPSSSHLVLPLILQHQGYAGPFLTLFSEILSAGDRFSASMLVGLSHLITAAFISFSDKLCRHVLTETLSPIFTFHCIRAAKQALFPNGYLGATPPEPSPEEQLELRAQLIGLRATGSLAYLSPLILGSDPTGTLATAIEPLSSAPCNVHLAVVLFDRVFALLFPELVNN